MVVLLSVGVLLNRKGPLLLCKGQADVDECMGRIIGVDPLELISQTLSEI
jgi:hypothetical protein